MKYTVLKRANPRDRSKAKWYAIPIMDRRVRRKEIIDEVSRETGIRSGIVRKIILTFFDVIVRHLLAGRSVTLRPLGVMRISFASDGEDAPELVTPAHIRDFKVIIIPDVSLKKHFSNICFEYTSTNEETNQTTLKQ